MHGWECYRIAFSWDYSPCLAYGKLAHKINKNKICRIKFAFLFIWCQKSYCQQSWECCYCNITPRKQNGTHHSCREARL